VTVGGIDQVDVACRELLLVASSARQKYNCTCKNQRKQLKQNNQTKRGTEKEESEAAARYQLTLSADMLLTKAETNYVIKYVPEANSLHRNVKEKAEEVKTVDLQLDEASF